VKWAPTVMVLGNTEHLIGADGTHIASAHGERFTWEVDRAVSLSELAEVTPFFVRLCATGSMREPEPQAAPEPERVVVRGWPGYLDGVRLNYTDTDRMAAMAYPDGEFWVYGNTEDRDSVDNGTAPTRDLAGAQACAVEALKQLHPGLVVVAVDQVEEG